MSATDGSTPVNAANVMHKASADTHTGQLTNVGDVVLSEGNILISSPSGQVKQIYMTTGKQRGEFRFGMDSQSSHVHPTRDFITWPIPYYNLSPTTVTYNYVRLVNISGLILTSPGARGQQVRIYPSALTATYEIYGTYTVEP